jgi:hypothetical protein
MIFRFLEQLIAQLWNSFRARHKAKPERSQLQLGSLVEEGNATRKGLGLSQSSRMTHLVVTGITGGGKSYFLRNIAQQDVKNGIGCVVIDQHGDLMPPILSYLAELGADPANVILIDPASREWAVGLNPLEASDDHSRFLQVAEMTRNIADRWDFRGARTEELLRNALFVLSANGLTLIEVSPLLTDGGYRAQLLKQVANTDVRDYFTLRYDSLSDAMKATMREPVLNKLAEFVGDPHFRHILGQRQSTFSFDDALATGKIILVNVHKGRLGVHATTFASLVLGKLTAAIFRRHERRLYSLFADEFQNLAGADADFDTLFSEARKFGVGIVTANQFLAQLHPKLRSALQAVGTRVFFQLSPEDASQVAQDIGGGKSMTERLRDLPPRHFIVKSGNHPPQEAVTPDVYTSKFSAKQFLERSNQIHARRREDVERDILARKPQTLKKALDDWE